MSPFFRKSPLTPFLLLLATAAAAQTAPDPLHAGFLDPPAEARPLVYWQWVNGNVSEDGIRLDLQWMQRAGLAGAFLFDIGFRSPPVPQVVEKRVGFDTPAWQSAVRVAVTEAKRLGLLLGAQSGGGWSVSGGPEVEPKDGMKKLVWAESELRAPFPKLVQLYQPAQASGPFHDLSFDKRYRIADAEAYEDVATIAYRLPDAEQADTPVLEMNGKAVEWAFEDEHFNRGERVAPDANGEVTLTARPRGGTRLRSLTLAVADGWPKGVIEASDDGKSFRTHIELPTGAAQRSPVQTHALGIPARAWRIRFTGVTAPLEILEARFDTSARIDRFEEKAGYGVPTREARPQLDEPRTALDPADIVDVTPFVSPEGVLSWTPKGKKGKWRVVRFGWSLTGRTNVPATDESLGLEVDKLDAAAVRRFATHYFARFGDIGSLGLALTDSWEAGQQNWTRAMPAEFAHRRGYSLLPWLPALSGRVIGDVARTERFLADFRRTIADLVADAHYGALAEVAHAGGRTIYSEAAGTGLPTLVDGLQAKGRVDVPMGEYWYYAPGAPPNPEHVADVREAASAAHIYGKPLVAAEALTTRGEEPFALGPRELRRIADRFFAEGVNRIVLHTSAHQPFADRRPGITLRQYGQHFTRNETWAEDARAWVDYLARASWLLQQGKPVADIAIFAGDGVPAAPVPDASASRPRGFDYDLVNAEVLSKAAIRDGRLVLESGASYRALVKPREARVDGAVLRERLRSLVADGLTVLESADTAADALRSRGVIEDVRGPDDATLHWTHRVTNDADIYFLTNQGPRGVNGPVRFRTSGRRPEAWNAVTGERRLLDCAAAEGATDVDLLLRANESVFVVFRGAPCPAAGLPSAADRVIRLAERPVATLGPSWDVEFLDLPNAPKLRMATLASWTGSQDPAIRYYSGRARYRTEFEEKDWRPTKIDRLLLDLGNVRDLARVLVNGRELGVTWTEPNRIDLTGALRAGKNELEIVVTNYWANRMIGDLQRGAQAHTFSTLQPFTADSPLRPSGLLGPVRLISVRD